MLVLGLFILSAYQTFTTLRNGFPQNGEGILVFIGWALVFLGSLLALYRSGLSL